MRFSLTTLLLVAFWIAAVMLVWVRREPWHYAHNDAPPDGQLGAIDFRAPDQRRQAMFDYKMSSLKFDSQRWVVAGTFGVV